MRHLLNSLFVLTEDLYATLDGENIVLCREGEQVQRFPLHNLENIFLFTHKGATPALMGKCAQAGIGLAFLTPTGRFLTRVGGAMHGNVLLRRIQYRWADDHEQCCVVARNMVYGKVRNSRHLLERMRRDHPQCIETKVFKDAALQLDRLSDAIKHETMLVSLRGLEGVSANLYFSLFDDLILRHKEHFKFNGRTRRPPKDRVNALLSYVYAIYEQKCASALEMVGLDSYVGFLHRDRPGRTSFALDLLEELRPCCADRLVLTMINNNVIGPEDFEKEEDGGIFLTQEGRRKVGKEMRAREQRIITHPVLGDRIEWGLLPYTQALLLARYLRGDIECYSPFVWH